MNSRCWGKHVAHTLVIMTWLFAFGGYLAGKYCRQNGTLDRRLVQCNEAFHLFLNLKYFVKGICTTGSKKMSIHNFPHLIMLALCY